MMRVVYVTCNTNWIVSQDVRLNIPFCRELGYTVGLFNVVEDASDCGKTLASLESKVFKQLEMRSPIVFGLG